MAQKRALAVLGYPMRWNFTAQRAELGPLAKAICVAVIDRVPHYDRLIFVGGWDQRGMPCEITIGIVMYNRLCEVDREENALVLPRDEPKLLNYMPPRDLVEEAILIREYLRCCNGGYELDVIVVREWMPRLQLICYALGIRCRFVPVDAPVAFAERMKQFLALGLATIDPLGITTFPLIGNPFDKNRVERTLREEAADRVPLISLVQHPRAAVPP
ncbi:hypothetical protein HY970_00035 [Candidatus Kaiserbacteria bacterium]|nr:hypothetical protein [Candidatus Kaiserbacteria bacterium]